MLHMKGLLVVLVFSLFCCLQAFAKDDTDTERLHKIFQKYLPPNTVVIVNGSMQAVSGDFNGDGFADFAVAFVPVTEITDADKLQVFRPWQLAGSVSPDDFHRSLVIFHGSKHGTLLDVTQVFVLLDDSGALETPSFELLIARTGDKDYNRHVSGLPVAPGGDLIVIPTEAGIDTYIYWHKNQYSLFEPEAIP